MNHNAVSHRWQILTAAPHRLMFFAGVLQMLISLLLWSWELAGRYLSWLAVPESVIPALWIHGFLMLYCIFPFFIFGFLMTTYPRWMNGESVPRKVYIQTFVPMFTGVMFFYSGIILGTSLMALGVMVFLAGWLRGVWGLLYVYRHAASHDKRYERLLNFALWVAALGMLLFVFGLLMDQPLAYVVSLQLGMWGFLLPVVITVAHRMIPFFSECVLQSYTRVQPFGLLLMMLAACYLRMVWVWMEASWLLLLSDMTLMLGAMYLSMRWGWRRSLAIRLLGMLHIAFSWLALGMGLYVIQGFLHWFPDSISLGRAPLHALAIGFISSMVLAMASRVSLGHSGRALQVDPLTWWLFLGINLVAVLRVLGELPQGSLLLGVPTQLLAALLWLVCISPWTLRMLIIYLTPRVDGRPG